MKKSKKVLFFIAGKFPTPEEIRAADRVGTMQLRNARLAAQPGEPVESCDAVAGAVPERYRNIEGVEVIELDEDPDEDPDEVAREKAEREKAEKSKAPKEKAASGKAAASPAPPWASSPSPSGEGEKGVTNEVTK